MAVEPSDSWPALIDEQHRHGETQAAVQVTLSSLGPKRKLFSHSSKCSSVHEHSANSAVIAATTKKEREEVRAAFGHKPADREVHRETSGRAVAPNAAVRAAHSICDWPLNSSNSSSGSTASSSSNAHEIDMRN